MKRILLFLISLVLLGAVPHTTAWDEQCSVAAENLPAEARAALYNSVFVDAIQASPYLFVLTEDAVGLRTVTVFREENGMYRTDTVSAPLPVLNGIKPGILASSGSLIIHYG